MGMKEMGGEKVGYVKRSSDTEMTIEEGDVNAVKRSEKCLYDVHVIRDVSISCMRALVE